MTNQIDYFEIGSPDPEASKAFYGKLFDWEVGEPSLPAGYNTVDGGRGGLWDTTALGGASWAIFYVNVPDVHKALEEAQELGATVAIPFIDNGTIEFAHLIDPHGNRFGIWRPKDPENTEPENTEPGEPTPSRFWASSPRTSKGLLSPGTLPILVWLVFCSG